MSNLLKEPLRTCWNSLEGSVCSDTSLEADWARNILCGLHPAPLILDVTLKKAIWRPTWWGHSSSSVLPAWGAHAGSPGQSPAGLRRWCSWWPGWRRSPFCPWAPAGLWSWRSPGQAQIKVSSPASGYLFTQYPRHVTGRVLVEASRSMRPASNAECQLTAGWRCVPEKKSALCSPLKKVLLQSQDVSHTACTSPSANFYPGTGSWSCCWLVTIGSQSMDHVLSSTLTFRGLSTYHIFTDSNKYNSFFLTIKFSTKFPQPLLLKWFGQLQLESIK